MNIKEITADSIMASFGEPAELRESAQNLAELRAAFEDVNEKHFKTLHRLQGKQAELRTVHAELCPERHAAIKAECAALQAQVDHLYTKKGAADYAYTSAERDDAILRNPYRDQLAEQTDDAAAHLQSVVIALRQRKEKRVNIQSLNKRIEALSEFATN